MVDTAAVPVTMRVEFPEPDLAVLTLDNPGKGANIFSRHVLEELDGVLAGLEGRTDLAGLIIRSAKPGIFIAGADLREFSAAKNITREDTMQLCRRGQNLFRRLSRMPFVTVAAIDGNCVGGGAELAVWCDRRLMSDSPKAQFGFPEVKIGIMPGWGGTVRTPRIIGLSNAVELITSGESIDGRAAYKMGLSTDVVSSALLDQAAVALVRAEQRSKSYLADRERWSQPIEISDTELEFLGATASGYIQQETKGHYPAPLAALEVVLGNAREEIDAACQAEAAGMAELFGTPISRALINVFFLTDRNKKDAGVEGAAAPRAIKSVGVIGAGLMGAGISAATLKRGPSVTITDAAAAALERGVAGVLEEVAYNKATKAADPQRAIEFASRLHATSVLAEFSSCDLVIEAVIENIDAKRQLYSQLEPLLAPNAILATNTSTIPIDRLAAGLRRPEQFCGIHFFNPVRKMPLVEVIRGKATSDETVVSAVAYAKAIGKSPIVVQDGPGFLVNRLLLPYMNEALELIAEGAAIKDIERAAKAFGMPMGPITLYDVVGLDTALYAGRVMQEAFPDRIGSSPILAALVEAGRKGQKSGAGFYSYRDKKGRGQPDPALEPILRPLIRGTAKLTHEQLTHRMFLPMVLEATRIFSEKIVRDARDVDLGLIYGIGFPPFKGGLLFWADTLGADKIVAGLMPFASLGARFEPTPMLLEMAKAGATFYGKG